MGQSKSKANKRSYDVAPVASDREFTYQNNQNTNENDKEKDKEKETEDGQAEPKLLVSDASSVANSSTQAQKDSEKPFDSKLIPGWLTEDLFVDILREQIKDFKRISHFKAYPALSAGENYATLMLRVSIDVELNDQSNKNTSFMLKVPHDSEEMRQVLAMSNFFVPENEMYLTVIPEIHQMYKDVGVDLSLSPNAHKFSNDIQKDYVLLQDLRPFGFQNASRQKSLDMEHAKCVLKKLAQLHAASATRVATKGPYIHALMHGIYTNKEASAAIMDPMMGSFKVAFLNNLKSFKDFEKYEPQLVQYLDTASTKFFDLLGYDESEFNVVNHGDCWSNNILFKYDDAGHVVDMQFVDLQLSKYGSPAQDLHYFIFSSLQIDIKLQKFDYLIRYYYDHLIENLKLLSYPKELPILREIYIQLFKYGVWTLWASVIVLPVVLLNPTDLANMANFTKDDAGGMAFKNALYSNQRYHEHINEILPWLYNRGLLEPYDYSSPKATPVSSTPIEAVKLATQSSQVQSAIPEWVKESLFLDILKHNYPGFKSIKSFNVSTGTSVGDHFASLILKVDVTMELENDVSKAASFMMKVPLNNDESKAMLSNLNIFEKEISLYHEFIPKLEEIYRKAGVEITFAPKYLHLNDHPDKSIVVLENLEPLGYKNSDRLKGLDEDHTKAVLRKLAEFHAASAYYALENDYPSVLQSCTYAEEQREVLEKMCESVFPVFNECVKTYEGHEEYNDKMVASEKHFFDAAIKAYNPTGNLLNVLNHGDVWTNNILFKHDDSGKIECTYLIDYQMAQYGSPAIDLYYFLLSSPALDIKLEKFDQFVRYYYDNLVENLNLLKYPKDIPTLKELHLELINKGVLGYAATTGVLSAVLFDPTESANIENSRGNSYADLKRQMYSNARYKKHAEAILPWLNRRGVLDADIESSNGNHENPFEIPKWLNDDYFNGLLQAHFEDFSTIQEHKIEIATKNGENYASLVLKVDIDTEFKDGSRKSIKFIIKIPPTGEQALFLMETWNSFKKEIMLFNEYIPEFEGMYKRAGHPLKLAPRYFRYQRDVGSDVVIIENLQVDHFTIADRLKGLDMEHTKCALRKMAQFHAASVKRIEIGGSYPSYFKDGMYNERSREMFEHIMQGTNKSILEATPSYDGSEEYIGKLHHLIDTYLDKAIELSKVDDNDFNVLNHGDCWVNNIMFQHDESGNVKETLFIDFQDCKYGSPAYDLYYFLISSTELGIKIDHFDEFIRYYHEQLVENFELLDYKGKVPSLQELHDNLSKHEFLALSSLWGITSLCLLEPSENSTIENIVEHTDAGEKVRNNMYTNPRYKACAEKVLTWLNQRGSLDQ